ncbi:MAG TPA: hypothetical protein VN861_06120 [Candidatus Acidoferrales bacterium]|nr:hypothetical protein [Candidatus Acidoferrales bacterium]
MRPTKLSTILCLLTTALAFSAPSLRAQDTADSSSKHSATVPRSSAEKYHAHAAQAGVSVGAELLTPKEVSKEFSAADLNRCCLVVQVALYPDKDEPLNISLDDFTLLVDGTGTPIRPLSAAVISAKLGKSNRSNGGATSAGVGVGYESVTYTDPKTGQPVHEHGVTTSSGTATSSDDGVMPAPPAAPDPEAIQRELADKGLPEAKIATPVSGYLYFALPKQKRDAKYRLEYILKDEPLNLDLP